MKPAALKFQRDLARRHVARAREAAKSHPMSDRRIAEAVAPLVGASVDQILKWMRESA